MLELPLSLLVVNLAQTPNWELAAEIVNMTSRTYRTAKHCKWRYENIVGPREEGKLLYDSPVLSPTSPTKKSKKAKTFIKITPPSPSKASRYLKTSQLVAQDNNSQLSNFFIQKFDTIKSISNKRQPTAKPMSVAPMVKSSKQAGIFSEHGIAYDAPLSASHIAQARAERLANERKKQILAGFTVVSQPVPQVQAQGQGQTPGQVSSPVAGVSPASSPVPVSVTSVAAQSPTISMALAGTPVQAVSSPTSFPGSPVQSGQAQRQLQTSTATVGQGQQQQIIAATAVSTPTSIISVPTTGGTYVASPQGVTHARLISVNQGTAVAGSPKTAVMGSLARPGAPVDGIGTISLQNVTVVQSSPIFTQATTAAAAGVTASALTATQRVSLSSF